MVSQVPLARAELSQALGAQLPRDGQGRAVRGQACGNVRGLSFPGPLPAARAWLVPSRHQDDGRRPSPPRKPLEQLGPAVGLQPPRSSQDTASLSADDKATGKWAELGSGQSGAPIPQHGRAEAPTCQVSISSSVNWVECLPASQRWGHEPSGQQASHWTDCPHLTHSPPQPPMQQIPNCPGPPPGCCPVGFTNPLVLRNEITITFN